MTVTEQALLKSFTTRGLIVLQLLDRSRIDHQQMKELVRQLNVGVRYADFLEDAWEPFVRDHRLFVFDETIPWMVIPFEGDYIPSSSSEGRFPSLSWLLARGVDAKSAGMHFWPALYETGYVFWDAARFGYETLPTYVRGFQ